MALKERKVRKIQRGISLAPELNERIRESADTFGMTWNEAAERALARAFLSPANSSNSADNRRISVAPPDDEEHGIAHLLEDDE